MSNEIKFFECKYCLKKLSTEARLEAHNCNKKQRWEFLSTKNGFQAYEDYRYWLKTNSKKIVSNKRTFVDSKFFTAFKEFQTFIVDKGIPDRKMYMDYMISIKMPPMMWRLQDAYNMFIRYFDDSVSVDVKVEMTLKMLDQLVEILECDRREVFSHLTASDISRLVFERRLSPWVLLLNKNFLYYMHNLQSVDQYRLLTTTIDIDSWKLKFKGHPNEVNAVKEKIEIFFNK